MCELTRSKLLSRLTEQPRGMLLRLFFGERHRFRPVITPRSVLYLKEQITNELYNAIFQECRFFQEG